MKQINVSQFFAFKSVFDLASTSRLWEQNLKMLPLNCLN